MKLLVKYLENEIIMEENIVSIEVENKRYFYRIVNDFYNISNGDIVDDIKVFIDNNESNISKKLKVFIDYFDFGLNAKKYSTDINKYIIENIKDVESDNLLKKYKLFLNEYNKVINKLDIPITIESNEININNIIKIVKTEIPKKDTLLENILLIIDLEKELKNNNILLFVNLKQYLSKTELGELYKYSIYNQCKVILIDSQSYGVTLEYEKKLIIDENLDEFML